MNVVNDQAAEVSDGTSEAVYGPQADVTFHPVRVTTAREQCLKPVDLPGRARERGVPSR